MRIPMCRQCWIKWRARVARYWFQKQKFHLNTVTWPLYLTQKATALPCIPFQRSDFLTIQTLMMTTQQIANRLAELCRKGEWATAQNELFAKDAVSIEQMDSPGFSKETR